MIKKVISNRQYQCLQILARRHLMRIATFQIFWLQRLQIHCPSIKEDIKILFLKSVVRQDKPDMLLLRSNRYENRRMNKRALSRSLHRSCLIGQCALKKRQESATLEDNMDHHEGHQLKEQIRSQKSRLFR